ncbi:molybdopterin-dependent oxidoreductase [Patescibacteria group bacterium]
MEKDFSSKDLLTFLMFTSFIILAGTGILKFKKFLSILLTFLPNIPLKKITTLHEFSALALIFFICIHLIFQRAWFGRIYKKVIASKKLSFFIIGIFFSGLVFLVYSYLNARNTTSFPTASNNLKQLAAVEIRQYEGEKLSSIVDFRENSIKGPQKVDIGEYQLEISGLVKNPYQLNYKEVLALSAYTKVVTLHCVEGWSSKILWEGVLIEDLIKVAEVKEGANTVIFHAYDGYTSSLSLDFVKNREILLAYKMNGVELPSERGFPFQVIAEDKWGYKWVKWVTKIELSDNKDYKGFWESGGYSVDGDVNGPKFD